MSIGDMLADLTKEVAFRFAREMIRQHLPSTDRYLGAMEEQTKRQRQQLKKEAKQRLADKRRKDVVNLPGGVQYFPPKKKGSPTK